MVPLYHSNALKIKNDITEKVHFCMGGSHFHEIIIEKGLLVQPILGAKRYFGFLVQSNTDCVAGAVLDMSYSIHMAPTAQTSMLYRP